MLKESFILVLFNDQLVIEMDLIKKEMNPNLERLFDLLSDMMIFLSIKNLSMFIFD